MPFSEGWRDQYERMLRSQARLAEAARPSSMGAAEARDRLYHFFQDAYHLKDWLIHDLGWYTMNGTRKVLTQAGQDLERHITGTRALANCADLCNGVKHLVLNSPRIAGTPANLASQNVGIVLGPFESALDFGTPQPKGLSTPPAGSTTAEHSWLVEFDGRYYDAVSLADEIVTEWQKALRARTLMY